MAPRLAPPNAPLLSRDLQQSAALCWLLPLPSGPLSGSIRSQVEPRFPKKHSAEMPGQKADGRLQEELQNHLAAIMVQRRFGPPTLSPLPNRWEDLPWTPARTIYPEWAHHG